MTHPEETYMCKALEAAITSANNGDYGHGAVTVRNGTIAAGE